MSSFSGDSWIDDELKNVAVPANLTRKLQAIITLSDDELDHALCAVDMPAGCLQRCLAIGRLSDPDLDDELRHVPVPGGAIEQLQSIPAEPPTPRSRFDRTRRRPRSPRFSTPALAASLLLAVGIGYLAATARFWWSAERPNERQITQRDQNGPRGSNSTRPPSNEQQASQQGADGVRRPTRDPSADEFGPADRLSNSNAVAAQGDSEKLASRSGTALRDQDRTNGNDSQGQTGSRSGVESRADSAGSSGRLVGVARPGGAETRTASGPSSSFPDAQLAIGEPLGSGVGDYLPPLRSISEPLWRGVNPPRERGYDLAFQLRHGVHPFVSPSAHPSLATCSVPLALDRTSFDLTWQATAERKLPPPYKLRVEEFLSAMDYEFAPAPDRALALRSFAGPSPWNGGNSGLSLLQIAALAGSVPRASPPSHLVLLLDGSTSMRFEGRWQHSLGGMEFLAHRARPSDRFSLVVMGEQIETVVERASPTELRTALQRLQSRVPQGASKVVDLLSTGIQIAGIQVAGPSADPASPKSADESAPPKVESGRGGHSPLSARLVLLTDGIAPLDNSDSQRLETDLQSARRVGVPLDILDVRNGDSVDGRLAQLVDAANRGRESGEAPPQVRHSATPAQIGWQLLEELTGESQRVATDVNLRVTFNPHAVGMYRLLGHETSVVGIAPETVETELRAGECSTALFELVLKSDVPAEGPSSADQRDANHEIVAVVEATWRSPGDAQLQHARQTVSRLQIAPSFGESAFSLQQAALAAETAEILRNSFFAPPNTHSLVDVANLARGLSPRLKSRPSVAQLVQLIERCQRSRAGNL